MIYTIPLSPKSLEWLAEQPATTQALLGWTLVNRGIPRGHVEKNYDVTPEDLEKALVYYWGKNYHKRAEALNYGDDSYDFIPAHRYPTLMYWFYRALPFVIVFLFGLICGLDWV